MTEAQQCHCVGPSWLRERHRERRGVQARARQPERRWGGSARCGSAPSGPAGGVLASAAPVIMGILPRSPHRVPGHDGDFPLSRIIDAFVEPVWAVDHLGLVSLVNPAAVRALGYDDASELVGRHGHATVHYRHRDGTRYPNEDCPIRRTFLHGETIRMEEDWFIRRDGSMFPVQFTATPLETRQGRGAVVAFTDIERRLEVEQVMRERDAMLARVAQPV